MKMNRMLALLVGLLLLLPMGTSAAEEGASGVFSVSDERPIVRSITVQGNDQIDTETILEYVRDTQIGEPLDVEKVRADVNRIAGMGFFQSVDGQPFAHADGARVVFSVREFPVIRDVEVTVREGVLEPGEVLPLIDVEVGRILDTTKFYASMDRLPVLSGEELGYILQPTAVDLGGPEGDVLQIELTPVRVGQIIIEGNEKTRDNVIERELTFASGDILSMEEIRTSLRRLGQLGYFEPIVPDFLITSDPLVIDVHMPLTEAKTGRAAFGAGYSSADGLVGYIEVADRNFLGRGEEVHLRSEFGTSTTTYDVGYNQPYLFGTPTSAGFNLYNRTRRNQYDATSEENYTDKRVGGDVTLGRPLTNVTRGFVTLKVEDVTVTPDDPNGAIEPRDDRTRSVILNTRTDTSDHLFYPTEGFRHNFSVELAGEFLGGNVTFTKYQTSFSKYFRAGRNNQTWAFRAIGGLGHDLPLQEEFRVGGSETVRGYRFGQFRGDRMFVAQGEYRFPINETVQAVVFLDAGNAWTAASETVDLGDLKVGAGVGVRINTPLGVMRIDYGVGEKGGHAYFSLGPTF